MRIKAVLFDLDGTLLNTLDDIAASANYVLERFGYPSHTVRAYKYFVGNGVDNLITMILPENARSPENIQAVKKVYLTRYREHSLDKTRPYGGVPEMTAELRDASLKLAVVSNKPDADSKFTVAKMFVAGTFDAVEGSKSGIPLKPDPAIINGVLENLGVLSMEAVMVGDTRVDFAAAQNAGCVFVGAKWGFRPEEASAANFAIELPRELIGVVRKICDCSG